MKPPEPILDFIFSDHARFEMGRRGIDETQVTEALAKPGQSETVQAGRVLYQTKL